MRTDACHRCWARKPRRGLVASTNSTRLFCARRSHSIYRRMTTHRLKLGARPTSCWRASPDVMHPDQHLSRQPYQDREHPIVPESPPPDASGSARWRRADHQARPAGTGAAQPACRSIAPGRACRRRAGQGRTRLCGGCLPTMAGRDRRDAAFDRGSRGGDRWSRIGRAMTLLLASQQRPRCCGPRARIETTAAHHEARSPRRCSPPARRRATSPTRWPRRAVKIRQASRRHCAGADSTLALDDGRCCRNPRPQKVADHCAVGRATACSARRSRHAGAPVMARDRRECGGTVDAFIAACRASGQHPLDRRLLRNRGSGRAIV